MRRIDLNADLGEGGDFDAELMQIVTSCNIACGGHAGDAETMRSALTLAKTNGIAAGAHPSFPDRENFGRTASALAGRELESALISQVCELRRVADEYDVPLTHLKPHGALYNMAARDGDLSESVVNVLRATLPTAKLVGPPGCELERCARARGVSYLAEGFADRAYEPDGRLRDRKETGAVIHARIAQTEQALAMATSGHVTSYDGERISLGVDTICVHGDTPDAYAAAKAIRLALEGAGIQLCAPH